jgi:MFS family permease
MRVRAGIFSSVAGPNLKAMLLNVNTPETRGTVFCCMYLADSFGKGVGPYVVSQMIQHFGSRWVWCAVLFVRCAVGCVTFLSRREHVFNLAMMGWVASGSLIIAVSMFLKRDETESRARIRSSLTTPA